MASKQIRIINPGGTTLYSHSVQASVASADVPGFVDFEHVSFTLDGVRINSWLQEDDGTTGVYWLRIPKLPAEGVWVQMGHSSEPQVSFSPRAEALDAAASLTGDGDSSLLKTATKEDDGVSEMPTVHPKVMVAQGWMKKDLGAGADVYDRILVDTPWTNDPPAGHTSGEYENPSIWCRQTADSTWVWPDLTGFPDPLVNEAVAKPPTGNNSDPTILWVAANSMPDYGGAGVAGPAADTLFLWHRQNGEPTGHDNIYLSLLTSTTGGWDGLAISAKSLCTGLDYTRGSDASIENRYISPGVVQEADGSLSMWCVKQMSAGTRLQVEKFTSDDGATWTLIGDCTIPRPPGMYGPYHLDVILAGGYYWLFGSTGPIRSDQTDPGTYELFTWRSVDGVTWELITPCALSMATNTDGTAHWYAGAYRPSALYIEGTGLELYIGSLYAGTGAWTDAAWSPTNPRALDEPIAGVFWMPARDFDAAYDAWPWPLADVTDASNDGTISIADSALVLQCDPKHARADAQFYPPTNFEQRYRGKVSGNSGIYPASNSTEGIIPELNNAKDVRYIYNGSTVRLSITDAPGAGITVANYNEYRSRRLGDVHTAQAAGVSLDATGDGTGLTTYTQAASAPTTREFFGWQCTRREPAAHAEIDWYFFRDALANEPVASVRRPGSLAKVSA